MTIIIIGGGICGLSTYLALKKHLPSTITIKLYESHPSPISTTTTIGGGLGLAPNGQRALHALNPRIVDTIAAHGFGCDTIHFRNASGRKLGAMLTGSKARYGFEQQFLPRAEVHAAVLAEVEEAEDVHWGRKVESVREEEERVCVVFVDGTTEEADLVLGCDGVRSVVRPTIVDNADAEYQ
jgi:2-polyprenyl-6-methoxyphenol hydroxylase-like FAD-dependent oxidoreductase